MEWKVLSLLRKFSDGGRMNFSQRYRYNEMAQRYAIYSDLWRKKSRIREEGYRRPQDALLSVQGVRVAEEEHEAAAPPVYGVSMLPLQPAVVRHATSQPFTLHSVDQGEREQVERLYNTLIAAKKKAGEKVSGNHRLLHHLRSEKDRADSQAVSLRERRILGRNRRRPRKTEGQSQNLAGRQRGAREETVKMITLEPRLYDDDGNVEIKILEKGYDDPGESPSLRSTASSNHCTRSNLPAIAER